MGTCQAQDPCSGLAPGGLTNALPVNQQILGVFCAQLAQPQNLSACQDSTVLAACQRSCYCQEPFCSGLHNDCCDLAAGSKFNVPSIGDVDCSSYAFGRDFQYCTIDTINCTTSGVLCLAVGVRSGPIYVKYVCRKTCHFCDEVVDEPLQLTAGNLISIYGKCASYGSGPNRGFCAIDEPDALKRAGVIQQPYNHANAAVFHFCKSSCSNPATPIGAAFKQACFRKEFDRVKVGQPTCDPAIECCDVYPLGQAVNDRGTCADYFYQSRKSGLKPGAFNNPCLTDLVSKNLYNPNGSIKSSVYIGQTVASACQLSCEACYGQCDSKNECCDYVGKNVGVTQNGATCGKYTPQASGSLYQYCQFDRTVPQFANTNLVVAQVCMRSCGCCYDEYADQPYVTGYGPCASYSVQFLSIDGPDRGCVSNSSGVVASWGGRPSNQSACNTYCHKRRLKLVVGGTCAGYQWDPQSKECKIFKKSITSRSVLVDGHGTQCFQVGPESRSCDTDLVDNGPWAFSGKVVSDVCRYSCGKCSPKYDASIPNPG